MAWRIDESVIRGEIDNREKGLVQGTIWLAGREEPVLLQLSGNPATDMAGCLLEFTNINEPIPLSKPMDFPKVEMGMVGVMTASRKVRVPDVPLEEFFELRKAGLPAPEHMANSVYFEWYSETFGRIVIESTDFELRLSEPSWILTPEEEEAGKKQSAASFEIFLQRLDQAIQQHHPSPDEDEPWDEFAHEKFLKEADARNKKYGELLAKYREHPDCQRIVAKEMGWDHLVEAMDAAEKEAPAQGKSMEEFLSEEQKPTEENDEAWTDRRPDPTREGIDWVEESPGRFSHPLYKKAADFNFELHLALKGIKDGSARRFLDEFSISTSKLAGALNPLIFREFVDNHFVVAYLKRALSHLHESMQHFERAVMEGALPEEITQRCRPKLLEIRQDILQLMQCFREMDP